MAKKSRNKKKEAMFVTDRKTDGQMDRQTESTTTNNRLLGYQQTQLVIG